MTEKDEYFTDINSEYIKNRTCLRIRISDNKDMELTFKGKSLEFNNIYAKEESNIKIELDEYNDLVKLLHSLGYYSYSIVEKTRTTFSKQSNNLQFNIMIDDIREVGSFIEFEILCNDNTKNISELKNELNNFVLKFNNLNLKEADIPYRDYVSKSIYQKITSDHKIEALLLDLDKTLINNYKAISDSAEVLLNFELLKKLKEKEIKLALVTTSKRSFVNMLIKSLKVEDLFDYIVCREDVKALKPDEKAYKKAINALRVSKNNVLAVEDSVRGLRSAKNANIKVIHISKKKVDSYINIDTFSRLAFILINN